MKKICKECLRKLPLGCFHKHKSCAYGVRSECKDCHNKVSRVRSKKYTKNNPAKRRSTILKSKYGISLEEYNAMLKKQNRLCKICGHSDPGPKGVFAVDHCHATGKVRGLLCYLCNMGLGSFRDSVSVLKAAIRYIEES